MKISVSVHFKNYNLSINSSGDMKLQKCFCNYKTN